MWNLPSGRLSAALAVSALLVAAAPAPGFAQIVEIIDAAGDGGGNGLSGAVALAVDSADNVYVSGSNSDNAFRISPSGTITQILDATGDGVHAFEGGAGVAVDASDNVYVGGRDSDNVFKISPSGTISRIIEATGDGLGNALNSVAGLAADSAGNVYVAGFLSNNVFRVTPAGSITEIIDSSGDGLGNPLSLVYAVAVDASDNVYAAGVGSDNAFRITPAGTISEIIDATGDGLGHPLDEASGLATDASGNVYVSGHNSDNAFRVTPTGTIVQIIDSSGDIANPLLGAFYLAVDSGQNVYVGADVSFNLFQIPPVGLVDQVIGFDGDGLGNPLTLAYGVVVDSADNVYVAGIGSDNVFRVTAPQPATGSLVPFEARLEIDIGGFPAQVATGVGVAAITGGGVKLPEVLQLASATFPVTHPALQQVGVTIDASVRAGTLAPLDGSQSLTKRIRVGGEFRICPLVALCPTSIAVGFSLSSTDPAVALGVGGGAGTNFMGHPIFGTEAWNAAFAGWSFGPVTLTTGTASGALQTVMRTGFLHAATSSTTSVVQPNGGLQLIAPTQIVVSEPGDPVITKLALFSTLTLEFLPEPNALFGLGFGAALLALLGWRRRR